MADEIFGNGFTLSQARQFYIERRKTYLNNPLEAGVRRRHLCFVSVLILTGGKFNEVLALKAGGVKFLAEDGSELNSLRDRAKIHSVVFSWNNCSHPRTQTVFLTELNGEWFLDIFNWWIITDDDSPLIGFTMLWGCKVFSNFFGGSLRPNDIRRWKTFAMLDAGFSPTLIREKLGSCSLQYLGAWQGKQE